MKDELTLILVESINLNPNIDPTMKIDLIENTLKNCKQKKIGKIIMDAVEGKAKPEMQGPKRKRGRPLGVPNRPRTENELRSIKNAKIADREKGLEVYN